MKATRFACLLVLTSTLVFAQSNPLSLINQPAVPKNPVPIGQSQPDPAVHGRIVENYGKLPLTFEANQGQTDSHVKFLSRGSGYALFLTGDEAVISMRGGEAKPSTSHVGKLHPKAVVSKNSAVLRMKLVKANRTAKVIGADELPGKSNYFIGNDPKKWRNNVPTYAKVKYEGVYSGIDLVYYGNQRQLEYDFVVAPGADPRRIRFDVLGAKSISQDAHGDLLLRTSAGEVRWQKPVVYQEKDGVRQEIDGNYVVKHGHRVAFAVAGYDSKRPLVIDPVLGYSTYLGGSGTDAGAGVAVDSSGNAYVTGYTGSTDFPTMNPLQPNNGGYYNAFVAKISSSGSAFVYSTYLGGSQSDFGQDIAVDNSGNAYVTGFTDSPNFPTMNALQQTYGGNGDGFVAKLNPFGSALVYSTYLGGSEYDSAEGIAVDSSGGVYLVGNTQSTNFPTMNAIQPANGGGIYDVFVARLNPTGSTLVYSTYLGGSGLDISQNVAVDSSGDAYLTGYTTSADFPVTPEAFQTSCNGGSNCSADGDAFVTELNSTGSALVYSTYLGGNAEDGGAGIAVNSSGNAYVSGYTQSTNFPTTNPFQSTYGGGFTDAFVAQLNPTGSALVYSTYLGGSGGDEGHDIAVDSSGNAYVTGLTDSPDFPTLNPVQAANGGGQDAFVTKLSPTGSALMFSTYLGGNGADSGSRLAVDSAANAYVIGLTSSTNFPTMNSLQPVNGGGLYDAFVTQLSPGPFVTLSPSSLNFGNQNVGTSSNPQNVTLSNSGELPLSISSILATGDFSQTNTCPVGGSLPAGSNCMISVTFTPTQGGTRNGSVMITDNAPKSPQSVPLTGVGLQSTVTLSPTRLDFGNQPIGIATSPQTSTLMNTGNTTLMIASITITGANYIDFSQNNNCGTSVPAGGSCTINVTFKPSVLGSESAGVSISDNAAGSPQSLPLTGTGTAPIVTFSPPSLTFGLQPVGTTSPSQAVTVTASGALSIASIITTPTANFGQTNNCGSGIPAGGSCQINVTFTPTAPGLQKGTLTITDSGAGSPQSVPLSGTGTQPAVTLSPTSLSFGKQTVGIASTQQVSTLKNTGNGTLAITSIAVTGANSSDFTESNNCGTSVPAGGSCKISVTFKPSSPGNESASVSITDSAPDSPQSLPLSGVGVLPAVTFSPKSLTFPTQVVFTASPAQKVTLTNTGLGVLKITAGGISGQFAGTTNCTPTIAPGASCTINVTFKPRNKGTLNGAISVTDNAPGSPQKVPLTGTGTYVRLYPTSVNFGNQPIHTTSPPKYITLTNKGSATVNFTGSGITITGTNAGDFAETNDCGNSVASGAICHIKVTFTPSAQGQRTASVSISDDGGGSPQMVPLRGTGTP